MKHLSKALVCAVKILSQYQASASLLFINSAEDDYESEAVSDSEKETLTSLCSDTETEHDS